MCNKERKETVRPSRFWRAVSSTLIVVLTALACYDHRAELKKGADYVKGKFAPKVGGDK